MIYPLLILLIYFKNRERVNRNIMKFIIYIYHILRQEPLFHYTFIHYTLCIVYFSMVYHNKVLYSTL